MERELTGTASERATYDDLIAAPEHVIAEIIDGELLTRRYFGPIDSVALTELLYALGAPHLHSRMPTTPTILLRPEVHFKGDVVVPEIGMWLQSEIWSFADWREFNVTPRWVLEYITPWTDIERHQKRCRVLASTGVPLLWRLDGVSGMMQTFENRARKGWQHLKTFSGDDRISEPPFAELEISLGDVYRHGRHQMAAAG